MRLVKVLVGLILVVLTHLIGARFIPGFANYVDLFLILATYQALSGNLIVGMLAGCIAGLTHDAVTGGPYGLHGFADTAIGYLSAFAAQRLVIQRGFSVLLLFWVAASVQILILTVLGIMVSEAAILPSWIEVVIRVIVSGILGVLTYQVSGSIKRRWEIWRRKSSSTLRFGR